MCSLGSMFSFQPNKLRHILKVASWWIIQHIFVSACSVGRKTWFMRKPWVPNSRSVISPKIWPCIHPFFPKYAPVSTPSSYCIGYRAILTTGPSYYPKCTLCNAPFFFDLRLQMWQLKVICSCLDMWACKVSLFLATYLQSKVDKIEWYIASGVNVKIKI